MISDKMEKALNEQIKREAYASYLYLSMASWCEKESLGGCANFLFRQSDEERTHMIRIFKYIADVDGHAITPEVKKPPTEFDSIQSLFKQVFEHEQKVTQAINQLVDLCYEQDDYSTLNFLQWYVEEQREEESLIRSILDQIKLIGDGPQSLYYIDKEIRKLNADFQNSGI